MSRRIKVVRTVIGGQTVYGAILTDRGSKFRLVYDTKNDVVLLLGRGVSWNGGWRNDLWVYHVGANRWEQLTPKVVAGKEGPKFLDNMPSGYDTRHNAVIFTDGNAPWACRYKR